MEPYIDNQIEVDSHNSRIVGYICQADNALLEQLADLQRIHCTTKTIIYTPETNLLLFQNDGFHKEGMIDKFFQGTDACILSKFYSPSRSVSADVDLENQVMQTVLADCKPAADLSQPSHFPSELAGIEDTVQLAELYRRVFAYYPTNVFDPQYLARQMGENYFFIIAKNGSEIISAASAVIKPEFECAEITDCATHPDFRGHQLTSYIIREIEKHLQRRQIRCLYSLTRASSIGMNMTVHRLGYAYRGRLVNNCMIYSGLEDMNVWTKYMA